MYETIATLEPHQGDSSVTGIRAYSALDLELLHHYSVTANASLASSIGLRPQEGLFSLPSIAFRSEYVLRAILALAALHLDYLQGPRLSSQTDYTAIAAGHINDALPAYRLALHAVTQDNCTALLICSSLLSIYVLAMSRNGMNPFHRQSESMEQDFAHHDFDLVSWLRLITGGMTAIRPWVNHILTTDLGSCLNSELWTVQKMPETRVQMQRDEILAHLERLWKDLNDEGDYDIPRPAYLYLSSTSKAALSGTLSSLRKTYLWVTFRTDAEVASTPRVPSPSNHDSPASSDPPRPLLPLFLTSALESAASTPCSQRTSSSQTKAIELSAILSFLHGLTDDFLLLLGQRHPFALVIMAHYAVVLQQKDVWWLRGLGEDMLAWVVEVLTEQTTAPDASSDDDAAHRFLRHVEWPRSVFGHVEAGRIDPMLSTLES